MTGCSFLYDTEATGDSGAGDGGPAENDAADRPGGDDAGFDGAPLTSTGVLTLEFEGSYVSEEGASPTEETLVELQPGHRGMGAFLSEEACLKYDRDGGVDRTGTIHMWIRPQWEQADLETRILFHLGATGGIVVIKDSADYLKVIVDRYEEETGVSVPRGDLLATSEWHHLAATWSDDRIALFVDGVRLLEAPPGKPLDSLVGGVGIGCDYGSLPSGASALFDQVQLLEEAATDAEVQAHFASTQ